MKVNETAFPTRGPTLRNVLSQPRPEPLLQSTSLDIAFVELLQSTNAAGVCAQRSQRWVALAPLQRALTQGHSGTLRRYQYRPVPREVGAPCSRFRLSSILSFATFGSLFLCPVIYLKLIELGV